MNPNQQPAREKEVFESAMEVPSAEELQCEPPIEAPATEILPALRR